MRLETRLRKISIGSVNMSDAKKISYQFKKLEKRITLVEAESFLDTIIWDWNGFAKMYVVNSAYLLDIKRLQFYANEIITRFPRLEKRIFNDYYEEAICDFAGVKYIAKKDKRAQQNLGFQPIILDNKPLYLFPLE